MLYRKKDSECQSAFRVLILGMGGEVSKGILKAVRLTQIPVIIYGACISEDSDGLYLCDKAYVSPYAMDPSFIPWLIELCNREKIDIVLSGVEEVLLVMASSMEELGRETKTLFCVSPLEKLQTGGDKWATCQWLDREGFPSPKCITTDASAERIEQFLSDITFPIIAKPRQGKGSGGVLLISSREEAEKKQAVLCDYVYQEYIGRPEEEYTVGCYYGLNGEIPNPIIMKRVLKNGSSHQVEVCENKTIAELSKTICSRFKPRGPLNIQLRLSEDGVPVPFEFNVRFSGTTPMRARFGFCDVKAMLREVLLHQTIDDCFHIRKGIAFRFSEEIYISDRIKDVDGQVRWHSLT